MKVEHCPFCLLRGVESELKWTCHFENHNHKFHVYLRCDICGYNSARSYYNADENGNDVARPEVIRINNLVSLAVRASIWTRFDAKDESTYPESGKVYLVSSKKATGDAEWNYKKGEFAIWIKGLSTIDGIIAYRPLPIPYKEEEKCEGCFEPIEKGEEHNFDGSLYCLSCFEKLTKFKCSGCDRLFDTLEELHIVDSDEEITGEAQYCDECFKKISED